jgi:lipoyl(octanoyl) transferase
MSGQLALVEVTRDYQWLGRMDYGEALEMQMELAKKRRGGEIGDTVLMLEHNPVYTIGRRPDQSSLGTAENLPHPVFEISRGGQATYHGPGQLVVYLILNLSDYGQDLHAYLRALEEGAIQFCRAMGLPARRREGLTGAWIEGRKLASIGVGVKRWISIHGIALNVCGDLDAFKVITPCGIQDVQMTALDRELAIRITVERAAKSFEPHLERALAKLARLRLRP